jgi:MoaA/NifB/PqqE/SkfB family radical SAM enzyme
VLGLDFGMSTNAQAMTDEMMQELMPRMKWIRVNFSAGDPLTYAKVMGVTVQDYEKVVNNVSRMVKIKAERGLGTTIGMQMVCRPQDIDQVRPYVILAQSLGVDYAQVKHCADNNAGTLGIDYTKYASVSKALEHVAAEFGGGPTQVAVKVSKMLDGSSRTYSRCFGPRFLLQISGSGLVAPCGMMFDEPHKDFWIGNICRSRLKDIWKSETYWAVMDRLASPEFNPSKYCGSLCVQHCPNKWLNADHKLYDLFPGPFEQEPEHVNFI